MDSALENKVVSILAYLADDNDRAYLENRFAANQIKATHELDSTFFVDLSYSQKLLLSTYCHLYGEAHSWDLANNGRLMKVRQLLGIDEAFTGYFGQRFIRDNSSDWFSGRSPIECILEPADEVTLWAANTVFMAHEDGSFTKKKILSGLDSKEYEHDFDRKALNTLQKTPGLDIVIKKVNQYGIEKLLKAQYVGSNIRVNQNNIPKLYRALRTVCEVLEIPVPDLYVQQGFINSFTAGVEKPIIVVTSGSLSLLTYDELLFVLGHEAGHIKSQHMLYHQMANIFPFIGGIVGSLTLGIGNIVTTAMQTGLLNWQRMSELTADRAGLLACQNRDAMITAMMKIAGYPPIYYKSIDPQTFLEQAKEFQDIDNDALGKAAKVLSVMFSDHPWTVMRCAEISKWVELGEYERLLELHNSESGQSDTAGLASKYCYNCGSNVNNESLYCAHCGVSLKK
jgi:Zn-dependent protease with chaperone function